MNALLHALKNGIHLGISYNYKHPCLTGYAIFVRHMDQVIKNLKRCFKMTCNNIAKTRAEIIAELLQNVRNDSFVYISPFVDRFKSCVNNLDNSEQN